MAPPRPIQAKRLMIFADGENLVSRYESIHAKGRTPRREVVYEPETYVWCPAFVARGEYIVLRAIYKDVPVGQLLKVELPHPTHLYWPDLDVDLAVESIEHPERFPLVSRARPDQTAQRARPRQASDGPTRGRRPRR